MNQDLGLRILSQIMSWDDGRARREFEWLRLMARWQYDGYRDFLAGVRFIESLAAWLQQFDRNERETAYNFVRNNLIYISTSKMQRLVELFYPRTVEPRLLTMVSTKLCIPKYKILTDPVAESTFRRFRRKTLFMGLSEGARIDSFRHANSDLSNDQLVIASQVDQDKWEDMIESLREDLKDPNAQFALVFLVDDFMGTGTTFLRYDERKKEWKGKLRRFGDSLTAAMKGLNIFESKPLLCVHHYIASHKAAEDIQARMPKAKDNIDCMSLFEDIHFSFGIKLPPDLPINFNSVDNAALIELTKKYYDPQIRTRDTDVGGVTHLGLGYGGCALPLVLEHNTPNNSIALLWAETDGISHEEGKVHAMRPLFRRRQRHS